MNIISISLFYKPIWPGFGTRFSELLVDETTKLGHNVTLYTGRIPQNITVDQKYRSKQSVEKMKNGILHINRLWTPSTKHEGVKNRTFVYSMFMLQCFFKVLFSRNVDLIMGLYPYPPFFFAIILLAKIKKINFILVEADLWPDNLLELGIIKNKTTYSIIEKITIWCYNHADAVIVITDELQKGLAKYFADTSKIKVLELGTDTDVFRPIKIDHSTYQNKFVVMYSGILSPNYDFDIILNSAKDFAKADTVFVIAGGGELKEELKSKILKQNLSNVMMEDPLPSLEDVVVRLNRADVFVMGMNDNMQAKTAHPSKIFEFMACGKPVVCCSNGAASDLLKKANGGIIVNPGDHKGLAAALVGLYDSESMRKSLGNNGLDYVKKHHSLLVFRDNLGKILSKFDRL